MAIFYYIQDGSAFIIENLNDEVSPHCYAISKNGGDMGVDSVNNNYPDQVRVLTGTGWTLGYLDLGVHEKYDFLEDVPNQGHQTIGGSIFAIHSLRRASRVINGQGNALFESLSTSKIAIDRAYAHPNSAYYSYCEFEYYYDDANLTWKRAAASGKTYIQTGIQLSNGALESVFSIRHT